MLAIRLALFFHCDTHRTWGVSVVFFFETVLHFRSYQYQCVIHLFTGRAVKQERGEKEVLADSTQSTVPPSTKLHIVTAQRALTEERKWRPEVCQARWDDHFSSRSLSLLLTDAIVPTRPTLPCSAPHFLSLSI